MAQHGRYWSCSSFANWLRGTAKPGAATSKEWGAWKSLAKKSHPYRFWMAETALGKMQDFVTWPKRSMYDIKYYCVNRWVTHTHSLTAHPRDIKPGTWCDVGNRFLPCLFNELVDFVEIETAWSHIAWGSKEDRAKYGAPWNATGPWRTRKWRSAEAGVDHLKWAAALTWPEDDPTGKPTSQATNAIEMLALYNWWTKDRPNRADPYTASGWSDYCEKRRAKRTKDDWLFGEKTPEERAESKAILGRLHELEAQFEKEDEDMMVRLIRVRNGLWT
jgi:hypothetical protein